jgi:plastocyanin
MRLPRAIPAALAALACGLAAPAGAGADATVSFTCCAYTPTSVTIATGESVTWNAELGHDFALLPGPTHHPLRFVGNTQPEQTSGTTATRTFATAGAFRFYCVNHGTPDGLGGMVGTVNVTAPGPSPGPGPAPAPGPGPGPSPGPSPAPADTTAPDAAISLPKRRTLTAILARGLPITIRANEAGQATASLRYRGRAIGRARRSFTSPGRHRVTVKLTRSGRRALRNARRARLQLIVIITDTAGNKRTLRRTFTAKR